MQMVDESYFENGREFYAGTYRPVWPRRNREHPSAKPGCQEHLGPLIDTHYVRLLIDRLDKLEQQTRPSLGEVSAEAKDHAAFSALAFASDLVEAVAGWAIDHQIGLAMKGLKFLPFVPNQTKDHPDYVAMKQTVDDHEHERLGGTVDYALDPLAQRQALINLLAAYRGAFGFIQRPALDALEALAFEEVLPILEPKKGNAKVKMREMRLQLATIGFLEFKIATGMRKKEALEIAAKVLCVAESTI